MSEIAKRKNIYLGSSELTSRTARMTTSSPNTTIIDDGDKSIDFAVIDRPDKPFKCSECKWAFKFNKNLLHHKCVKH